MPAESVGSSGALVRRTLGITGWRSNLSISKTHQRHSSAWRCSLGEGNRDDRKLHQGSRQITKGTGLSRASCCVGMEAMEELVANRD